MTPLEMLVGVKTLIEQRGWAQGSRNVDWHGGPLCPNVALFVLLPGQGGWDDRRAARNYIARAIPTLQQEDVVPWNDEPTRTKQEVLAMLDRAIALATTDALSEKPE